MTATIRIVGVALATLAVAALTAAPAPATSPRDRLHGTVVVVHHPLRDLQPATAGPLDDAAATALMLSRPGRTTVLLKVRGIDRSERGRRFGAHLHTGPCVTGDGAAGGPHYNADVVAGRVPPRVDRTTEIWLDFTATRRGTGLAVARVPFVPRPGSRSIVIHRDPTDHHGTAGPRLACLPLSW